MKTKSTKIILSAYVVILAIFISLTSPFNYVSSQTILVDDYRGFYVENTKLYDGNHQKFIPIGVNSLFKYVDPGAVKTIPNIAKSKANCIRMFWNNDSNVPLDKLDSAINLAIDNKLIVIAGMWDATGDWNKLDTCVNFWLRSDVKAMVDKYEEYFILNIANEAGASVNKSIWEEKYISIIKKLREAGYRVPLLIDAAGYGRDESYIIECGVAVKNSDPLDNTMFDWHPWDSQQPRSRYTLGLEAAIEKNLCMIIGEFNSLNVEYNRNIDWKAIVEECNKNEVGWLPWSWSFPNDKHNVVNNFLFEQPTAWGALVLTEMEKVAKPATVFEGLITPTATIVAVTPTLTVVTPTPTPTIAVVTPTPTPPIIINKDKTKPKITVKNISGKMIKYRGVCKGRAKITVYDKNLKSKIIKRNGRKIKFPSHGKFFRKGSYEIISTDKAGNLSTFRFKLI